MKKVIERMDGRVKEAQRAAGGAPAKEGKEGKEKSGSKWGLPGLGGKKKEEKAAAAAAAEKEASPEEDEGPEGLRVDQYLVVFLKFMSSIGEHAALNFPLMMRCLP